MKCDTEISGALRRWVFVVFLLGTLAAGAWAQSSPSWNSIGPAGGTVTALLTSPVSSATIYAGSAQNGVFVSTDAGTTWSAANNGLGASTLTGRQTLYAVYALATDGQFVYAATAAGLFYSSLGVPPVWVELTATGSSTPITLLAFDSASSRLFAATGQTNGLAMPGVYVTPIFASAAPAPTWTFVQLPAAAGTMIGAMTVVAAQGAVTQSALMVGVGANLYTASILPGTIGLSWIDADPSASLAAGTVTAITYSADFLQAYSCSGGTVFYSGNALGPQAVWLPASAAASAMNAFSCNAFASVPIAVGGAPQIVLGTDQGVLVSLDGTNFLATGSLGPGPSAYAFAIGKAVGSSMSTMFAGAGYGVASVGVSALAGNASWSPSNGPASIAAGGTNLRLNNANIVDTAFLGTTLYGAAVANQYVEVFSSSDGGATWTATNIATVLNPGGEIIALAADPTNAVLYAATTQGLLAYTSSGARWAGVAAATIAGRAASLALGTNALFVGTDVGLFALPRSATPSSAVPVAAGLTGSSVRSLLVSAGSVYAGTIDPTDNNFVFSATETLAAAGTAVWAQYGVSSAGTNRITSLVPVGTDLLLAATNGSLVLYASSGSAWASANTNADPAQKISDAFGAVNSLYSDGLSIYAATGSNGVFVSPVATTFSWTAFSGAGTTALPSLEVHTLRANGGTLYAATRAGIASLLGSTSGTPSGTPSPPASAAAGSGGGAFEPFIATLLLGALLALRKTGSSRTRSKGRSARAPDPRST